MRHLALLIALLFAGVCESMMAQQAAQMNAPNTVFADPRIAHWATEYLADERPKLFAELEQDLISSDPHPLAVYIWAITHLNQNDVEPSVVKFPSRLQIQLRNMVTILRLTRSDEEVAAYVQFGQADCGTKMDYGFSLTLTWDFSTVLRFDDYANCVLRRAQQHPADFDSVWDIAYMSGQDLGLNDRIRAELSSPSLVTTPFATFSTRLLKKDLKTADYLAITEEWLRQFPDDHFAWRYKSIQFANERNYSGALEAAERAIALAPWESGAYRNAGCAAAKLERLEDAKAIWQRWAKFANVWPDRGAGLAAANLASCLDDKASVAEELLLAAQKTTPDNTEILYQLLRLYITQQRRREEIATAKQLVASSDNNATRLAWAIWAFVDAKQYGDAAAIARRTGLHAKTTTWYYQASAALIKAGDNHQAQEIVEESLRNYPDWDWGLLELASMRLGNGDAPGAEAALRSLFALQDPSLEQAETARDVWLAQKPFAQAREQLLALQKRSASQDYFSQNFKVPDVMPALQIVHTANSDIATKVAELQIRSGHTERITHVGASADWSLLLSADEGGVVKIWNGNEHDLLRSVYGDSDRLNVAVISPDGKWFATAGEGKVVRIWSAHTGKLEWEIKGFTEPITGAQFSRDSKSLAMIASKVGKADQEIAIWTLGASSITENQYFGRTGGLAESIRFAGDHLLVVGPSGGNLVIWSVPDLRLFGTATCDGLFASDGKHLWTTSENELQTYAIARGLTFASRQHLSLRSLAALEAAPGGVPAAVYDDAADHVMHIETLTQPAKPLAEIKYNAKSSTSALLLSPAFDRALIATGAYTGVGYRPQLSLIDVAQKHAIDFAASSSISTQTAFSSSGRYLAFSSEGGRLQIWDTRAGQLTYSLGESGPSVAFSPDEEQVVTCYGLNQSPQQSIALTGPETKTRVYRTISGTTLHRFSISKCASLPSPIAFGNTGMVLLHNDTSVYMYNWRDTQLVAQWDIGATAYALALSPDDKLIAAATNGKLFVWEAKPGATPKAVLTSAHAFRAVAFSTDGRLLAAATGGEVVHIAAQTTPDHDITVWSVSENTILWRKPAEEGYGINAVAWVPGANGTLMLAAAGDQKRVQLYSAVDGKLLASKQGHSGIVSSLAAFPGRKFLVSSSEDGTSRLWSTDTTPDQPLATLIAFDDGTWAVLDREGRYDAANAGDIKGLHWIVGDEMLELAQLKTSYYEPNLLAKIVGLNSEKPKAIARPRELALYPETHLQQIAGGKYRVILNNRGGGIGKVEILLNDKVVDTRTPEKEHAGDPQYHFDFELPARFIEAGVENVVELVVWNQKEDLSKRGFAQVFQAPLVRCGIAADACEPIRLHAIVVGISDYQPGGPQHLNYASKDATEFAGALCLASTHLLGQQNEAVVPGAVDIQLFTSTAANNDHNTVSPCAGIASKPATRRNLEAAFAGLKNSAARDLIVVYLSGHGFALSGRSKQEGDLYIYPTMEAASSELSDYVDADARADFSISTAELADWLKQTPGRKQVLIIDTCGAGAAAKLAQDRSVPASQVRALDALKDATGFFILMGSAADAASYEASRYGQGLLTYSLLEGLKVRTGAPDGETIGVQPLFEHARSSVPDMARGIGGIQIPFYMAPPQSVSFPLGMVSKDEASKIKLNPKMPLLLHPRLLDPNRVRDDIDGTSISDLLARRFYEATFASRRGGSDSLLAVYVNDEDETPDAVMLNGTYQVQNGRIDAKLNLQFIGQHEELFEVHTPEDVNAFADAIMKEVADRLSKAASELAKEPE